MGRRRRMREMERRLAVLDEWDRRYGVGGAPPGHPLAKDATSWRYHSPDGLPPLPPLHGGAPRPLPGRRAPRRRRSWPGVVAVVGLVAGVVAVVEYPEQTRAVTGQTLQAGRELWGVATGEPAEASRVDVVDLVELASPFGWSPASGERVLPAVEAREEGAYAFVSTQPGSDDPVGFSPCGVVEVAVNPDRAPRGYEELVAGSLERLTLASGLQLTLVGETTDTWEDLPRRAGGPVVIAWADSTQVPELSGQVAGLGGALTMSGRQGTWAAGGRVVLDVDADLDGEQRAALLDHELAHVLGLDHVDDPGELMAPTNVGRTSFGPGDLAGLARLGAIPCP